MQRLNKITQHLEASSSSNGSGNEPAVSANPTTVSASPGFVETLADLYRTMTGSMAFRTKMHGGKLVAQVLKAHGVKHVTTLSGGHISPILVAVQEQGIRIVDVRHEGNAVFCADATARLTGVPGVAAVTAGPGVMLTASALVNAKLAESPIVLLGGAAATLSKGRGALQDIDQLSPLKSICKYVASPTSVRDVVPALRRAFQEAMSGVPGPCFVELPLDVLYPITEAAGGMSLCERKYKRDVAPEDKPRVIVPEDPEYKGMNVDQYLGVLGEREAVFLEPPPNKRQHFAIETFMRFKLRSLHAGAWDDTEFGPLPVEYPRPVPSDVQAVSALLAKAKRPVLVVGSQATLGGPRAAEELGRVVSALGVPTFLGGMARGLLGPVSEVHIRQNRGAALAKADLVILAGAICDFRLGYGQALAKKSKVISINRSKASATLNSGLFWSPHRVCVSDPGEFVRALADMRVTIDPSVKAWRAELKEAELKKEAKNAQDAAAPAYGRVREVDDQGRTFTKNKGAQGPRMINPLQFFNDLEDVLPSNAVLVADGGDFVATSSYILRPRGPLGWLDPGAFGTLGVGAGFALAVALTQPDKEVYLVWGDGSCGYSIAEFDTFKRHNLPIVAVVGNDAGWTQIEREQAVMFGSDVACGLDYLQYDQVARGYGGQGMTLQYGDPIKEKLREAQSTMRRGDPVLVNVMIGGTSFREGSLSV